MEQWVLQIQDPPLGGTRQPLSCSVTQTQALQLVGTNSWRGRKQQEKGINCTRFDGSTQDQTTSFLAASLFLASRGSGCIKQPVGYCSLSGPTRKIQAARKQGEFCFPSSASPELSCIQRSGLVVQGGNKGEVNPIQALFNHVTLLFLGLC